MATTNLIVDFLVIGLVSSIWLAPIALLTLEVKVISEGFKAGPVAIPFILGFAYILGISVNRLADNLTNRWNDRWRDEIFGVTPDVSYHKQLNLIIARSDSASEYLGYRRSVIRTARASAINFLLAAILWISIAIFNQVIATKIAMLVSISSAFFSMLLFSAWKTVLRGYFHGIKDLYNYLNAPAGCNENDNGGDK